MDANQAAPETLLHDFSVVTEDKKHSSSSSSSNSSSSSSEDGGFVSGEEDFETASERPVVEEAEDEIVEKYGEDFDSDVHFVDSPETLTPRVVMPVAIASPDDDDENDVLGDKEMVNYEDDKGVEADEDEDEGIEMKSVEDVEEEEVVEKTEESEKVKVNKKEAFSGDESGRTGEINGVVELVGDKLIEAGGEQLTTEGDGEGVVDETAKLEDMNPSELVLEKPHVEETDIKEAAGGEKSKGLDGNEITSSEIAKEESNGVEIPRDENGSAYDKLDEVDVTKFPSKGDSPVEALNVDLAGSGTSEVLEENKDSDSSVEILNDRSTAVENGCNLVSTNAKEPVESEAPNRIVEHNATDGTGVVDVESNGAINYATAGDKDENSYGSGAVGDSIIEDAGLMDVEEKLDAAVNTEADPEAKSSPVIADLSDSSPKIELTEEEVAVNSPSLNFEHVREVSRKLEAEENVMYNRDEEGETGGSDTDEETERNVFESEAAKRFLEELERGSDGGSHDHSQIIDGQIETDTDEEVDTDDEGEGKELFDSAALAALLRAATGGSSDAGNITITSQEGSRLFSVERPAGLGSSIRSIRPAQRPNNSNIFAPSSLTAGGNSDVNLTEEEKRVLEKLQQIRVKFLRLIQRLGQSAEDSIGSQVLYRLAFVAGKHTGQLFGLEAAKKTALQLETQGEDDLNFSLNILVLGKSGVGKSATINSIFGLDKAEIHAFTHATASVKELRGIVDGVQIRVIDTPGLGSTGLEQGNNQKVLSIVKKLTKKCPPDIVIYVDRLDCPSRDLNDIPLLKTITTSLGPSIWRNAVVALTHAASAPTEGPTGTPLSYEAFVAQRSHVIQQSIGQAVGDLRMMNPSLMNPVALVENHSSCRKNRDGLKVLPNGQTWRPQLLLLCYSLKILAEASSVSKPQDVDHRKLFGFRVRSPPLPYLLSWLLQSRTHPKLANDQGGDNVDSDIDIADLSDSDQEDDVDEYDSLPPFKPLRKVQLMKLSKEQKKAYFEEYDYRVKLLQKKQWKDEVKRMRDIKKNGKASVDEDATFTGEDDPENGGPAAVPVPLPDMVLPPSFDGDNPAYRYRFLEPTSQFLARPVLDTHGWDHDCGYDGVNIEQTLAIVDRFPGAINVQVTKDKKEFNIHLDSSISAKHGENGSTMAGFDIQNVGKQLAYILRGETKFKNFKMNKTTAGVSVTFLGENVATGVKIEDQITVGKRFVLVGSTGTVRSQSDAAYGANLEVRLREADFPIGQDQSSLGLSLVKWRGDLALGANLQSQISIGRGSKVAIRAGLNNKLSGQINVKVSSSEQLQLALAALLPIISTIYKMIKPGVSENYSMY